MAAETNCIVPVIFGPTAVGKTEVAIEIAQKLNAELISADSMQVYKGMDIGTGKASAEQLKDVPHYLIDIRDITQPFSVAEFLEETRGAVQILILKKKVPIIVGGTGMYLNALIEGYTVPRQGEDKELRLRLEEQAEKHGIKFLYKKLQNIDPHAAAKIHKNDRRRIIRALEVFEHSGNPITKQQKKRRFMEGFDLLLIGLNRNRDELYKRIEQRVEGMIELGLIEEVKSLLDRGLRENRTAMQALGYKETVAYLDGEMDKDEYIAELKKRTRNFARRQLTWFRRFSAKGGSASGGKDVKWFEMDDNFSPEQIAAYISENL